MAEVSAIDSKRVRLSQQDVPSLDLERSLRLARALWDQFAGRSAKPLHLAGAIDLKPTSGGWRGLAGASIAYGLTDGGSNAQEIKLTELGRRIVAPREEGDDYLAIVEASMMPRVCREFLQKYDGSKFPNDKIAASVLIDLGVPKDRTDKVVEIIKQNCKFAELFTNIKGDMYVSLGSSRAGSRSVDATTDPSDEAINGDEGGRISAGEVSAVAPATVPPQQVTLPRKIFVAHGRKHTALDAIKKALDRLKVPYVVAQDEPHAGRPISEKVAQLMKECSAGIFIFTPDEEFIGSDDKKIYRPSENVIYELGAGSVLWGKKIVILKEESVYFPSDYRDLGYISFSMDNLISVQSNLLMELIALDFVRLQVG